MNKSLFAWTSLIIAGVAEVIWAYYLKNSQGFTVLFPSLMFFIFAFISFAFLGIAVKYIPISISYPIWTGIGAVGTIILGAVFFGEAITLFSALFLLMIIIGIIGLKLS